MKELANRINELLSSQAINIMLGYRKNIYGEIKPLIFTSADMADQLVFEPACTQNLIAYLNKPEIKAYKKIGIAATLPALRSFLQLTAESRFRDLAIVAFALNNEGKLVELNSADEIEKFVELNFKKDLDEVYNKVKEITALTTEQRWDYWVDELKDCIKCYACRSACPMCYCDKCSIECNNPQWVPIASHGQGNVEWHIMRAMHLAGRCVNCNECARACPMDIPLNLITAKLNQDIETSFGQIAGMKAKSDYVLSSYKFEDKDNFIR